MKYHFQIEKKFNEEKRAGKTGKIISSTISIIFFFLIVFVFQLNLSAQTKTTTPTNWPEPYFEHITIEDGLPENSVTAILQDHLGYLWLGTLNGLAMYDGYNMKVYQPDPDDSLSISGRFLYGIYEDKSGTLWIGTRYGGLNRFNRATETFTRYLHNPDDSTSINSNWVTIIYEDKVGNFLVGTINGLNLFDRETEIFQPIYHQGSTYSPNVYEYILSLKADGKTISSILQVGDNADLTKKFKINKKTIVLIINMGEAGYDYGWLESANGERIAVQKNNVVSAGGHARNQIQIVVDTLNRGKYQLRYVSDQGVSYNSWGDYLPDYPDFWGIQVIELAEGERNNKEILDNIKPVLLLNSYSVRSILEDRLSGNLFVSSGSKILTFDKDKQLLTDNNRMTELISGLGEIYSLRQSIDGTIWIGSSLGLSKLNTQQNSIKLYQHDNVSLTMEDNNGFIWGGSLNKH